MPFLQSTCLSSSRASRSGSTARSSTGRRRSRSPDSALLGLRRGVRSSALGTGQARGAARYFHSGARGTPGEVVVHQTARLHQRVERRRSHEAKATALEVACERDALGHRRGHVRPACRGPLASRRRVGAWARISASSDSPDARRPRVARAFVRVASIFLRLRTMPESASRRSRSTSSKLATTSAWNPAHAALKASRLARIVRHESPDAKVSSATFSNSPRSSRTGKPHSSS